MGHEKKMCIRAVVSGKVQGVYFRDSTQKKAEQLGLTGWVKNLEHGDVELVACGSQDSIMILTEWLWEGPPLAEVHNVHWETIVWENHKAFAVAKM